MIRINKTLSIVIAISIILVASTILYYYKTNHQKKQDIGLLDFYSKKGKKLKLTLEPDIKNFLLDNCHAESRDRISNTIDNLISNNAKNVTLSNFYNQYKSQYSNSSVKADYDSVLSNYTFTHTNDEETIYALSRLMDDYLIETLDIIKNRLAKTDLQQVNILLNKSKQRIELEVEHLNRMHEFIQFVSRRANLNLWETYSQQELVPMIIEADKILSQESSTESKNEIVKKSIPENDSDTMTMDEIIKQNEVSEDDGMTVNQAEQERKKNPIRFNLLGGFEPPENQATKINEARISFVRMADTAVLNKLLNDERVKKLFPSDLVFMYGPAGDEVRRENLDLLIMYGVKVPISIGKPIISGKHLMNIEKSYDPYTEKPSIQLAMDLYGSKVWERMTRNNINKPIAIAIDDMVLSAPAPTEAISGGRSSISGSFTEKEIDQLVYLLQWGALPVKLNVRKENVN